MSPGLVLLLLAAPALAQPSAKTVALDPVRVERIDERRPVLSRLIAARRGAVAAQIAGVVAETPLQVGDRVEQGAVLARLIDDAPRLALAAAQAALAEAQARRDEAEASLELAEQALARVGRLRESSAFSSAALQERQADAARARGALVAAEAAIASARARRDKAAFDLENAVIRAPFSGVVTERFAQPGAYLSPGAAVATLLDPASLELEAPLSAPVAAALAPGFETTARIGGVEIAARLRAVIPEEEAATRSRPGRFTLDGVAEMGFAAGQSAEIDLPSGPPRDALTVHKDAVVQGPDGPMAFIAVDGAAQARDIELGAPAGARIEARSGLAEGDLAIIRGNERLEPGEAVEAIEAARRRDDGG